MSQDLIASAQREVDGTTREELRNAIQALKNEAMLRYAQTYNKGFRDILHRLDRIVEIEKNLE